MMIIILYLSIPAIEHAIAVKASQRSPKSFD
jgi:hypothetical protein